LKPEESIDPVPMKGVTEGIDSEKPIAKGNFHTVRAVHRTYTSNLTSIRQGFVL
jgi:hypothetical protein